MSSQTGLAQDKTTEAPKLCHSIRYLLVGILRKGTRQVKDEKSKIKIKIKAANVTFPSVSHPHLFQMSPSMSPQVPGTSLRLRNNHSFFTCFSSHVSFSHVSYVPPPGFLLDLLQPSLSPLLLSFSAHLHPSWGRGETGNLDSTLSLGIVVL